METYMYNIMVKSFKNEIETSEKQELDDWLKIPDNQIVYTELEKVWKLTGNIDFTVKTNINQEWDRFNKLVNNNSEIAYLSDYQEDTKPKKTLYLWSLSIAASVILFCMLGYIFFRTDTDNLKMHTVLASNQKRLIELPDGSRITLNIFSQVSYPEEFNKYRKVDLKGEAFFEVTKGKGKFTVLTPFSETVVLGTGFNLKSDTINKQEQLIVVEGKVKFTDSKNKIQEIVENGQQAILDVQNHKINKTDFLDNNVIAWKTGKLSFNNTNLSEIVNFAEKYFGKEVIVNQSINDLHYTGNFEDPSEKDFFDILTVSLGISYVQRNDSIFLGN